MVVMPAWRIYRACVGPLLERLELDFDEVAYVNLCKWRTPVDGRLPLELFRRSWEVHTGEQLQALAPRAIAVLGIGTNTLFSRLHSGDTAVVVLRRSNGDRSPKVSLPSVTAAARRLRRLL